MQYRTHTDNILREQVNMRDCYSVMNHRNVYSEVKNMKLDYSPSMVRQNTTSSKTVCKSFDLTQYNNTYDVRENQRKLLQLHDQVRKGVPRLDGEQQSMGLLDKMTTNKSLLDNENQLSKVRCQSKRLNEFIQRDCPIKNLLNQRKGPISNKFQQIENDLDANMMRMKKNLKSIVSPIEDEHEVNNTHRKTQGCSCKCNQQILQSQCTKGSHSHISYQHSQQPSNTQSHMDPEPYISFTSKKPKYNSSFIVKPMSSENGTQTSPARDYRKKYKELLEKVRQNELFYLDLKKQNMRLSSENENQKESLDHLRQERIQFEKVISKLKLNVSELTGQIEQIIASLHEQYNQQNQGLLTNQRELEKQLEAKDQEQTNWIKILQEKTIQIQVLTEENSTLQRQCLKFEELDKHIQELESLYLETIDKFHQQVKKHKLIIKGIKQALNNVLTVTECYKDNLEIPLQSLIQHRHIGQEMEETNLLSSRSQESEQIQNLQKLNGTALQEILTTLQKYLDTVAERQVHKMGDMFLM